MESEKNIRDRIIALFTERLGEPDESASFRDGPIVRWKLERGPNEVSLLLTIDSPEWPDMAHVIISDSRTYQADPVTTVTLYTLEEAQAFLERVVEQWKSASRAARRSGGGVQRQMSPDS